MNLWRTCAQQPQLMLLLLSQFGFPVHKSMSKPTTPRYVMLVGWLRLVDDEGLLVASR